MGSGEQSVEKVHWIPTCLPLSADSWAHQELDKQFGKWFGSDSSLEYAHLHAFDDSCRYAQPVSVWLTSVSCSRSSTCLSSCLASAPTANQTCSSNTYISISCGESVPSCNLFNFQFPCSQFSLAIFICGL